VISIRELEAIVRQYPAEIQHGRVEPLGGAGGMSGAQFWRVRAPAGEFVVRRWPIEHPTEERLRFIHDVVFHAAERGATFLAVPMKTTRGESYLVRDGHLWEVARWLPGAADYEKSPSDARLQSAMRALATFHDAVRDYPMETARSAVGPSAVARHLARLRELSQNGAAELNRTLEGATWPELTQPARRFVSLLRTCLPRAIGKLEPLAGQAFRMQPCLRDIWHDHVLFTGDKVNGIIDYGAIDIDTPATDIARLLGSLVGDDALKWRVGIEAYSQVFSLTPEEDQATRALDASGLLLAGCNWLRWIGEENRQFENRVQIVARFRRIVERCEFGAAH
jgi:homoserine kinase type II